MTRRPFPPLAPLLLVALLLACAPSNRPQEIVFWQFFPADAVNPLLRAFEAEHPGVTVRMEQLTWDSGQEKITAAVAAGQPPDLCELGSTWMPRMLESGALADWSAGVADLRPTLRGWEQCNIGDALYGLPWMLGTRALFWNKTLFARAGLDTTRPPATWAELRRAAAAVHALGGGVAGYGVQAGDRYKLFKKFMPYAWGNGGEVLSPGLDSARFDSPENREALEFYLSLREVGRLGQQDALDQAFKEGKIGAQISGAWLFRQIPRDAPELRWGVALVPKPAAERGEHASFAGGEVLVSFNAAKRKALALELARFLARPENQLALAAAVGSVQPSVVGIDTAGYYRDRPAEQVMLRQFETARFTPNHPAWGEMEAAIEREVEEALHDRKDAARAVADAHAAIAGLLGRK